MSGILKSKTALFIGLSTLVGVGTVIYFQDHSSSKTVESVVKEKTAVQKTTSMAPPPVDNLPQVPVKESAPVVSNATIDKSSLASLRTTFAEMGKLRELNRSKDKSKRPDSSEKRELLQKIKGVREDVTKAVKESDVARKQLLDAVKDEKDPYAKKELARLLRSADPEIQTKYYMELAGDPAKENKEVAVEMLGGVHTQGSLTGLVGMVENSSVDTQVRSDAVRSLGMSIPFASDNTAYQQSARSALIGMIEPQYDANVRNDAYRAIAMQTSFSPEDEAVISKAIEKESDPQVKRTAQFVQNVIDARKESGSR